MKRRFERVYIGLGSNLGNRKKSLTTALKLMKQNGNMRVRKLSSLYETSAIGPKQNKYMNAVAKFETALSPEDLLFELQSIEQVMGRKRRIRWGPRNIDLDILFYGTKRILGSRLTVPHPQFHKRKFVLIPFCEIAPRYKPVGFRRTIARLAQELTAPEQKVRLFGKF